MIETSRLRLMNFKKAYVDALVEDRAKFESVFPYEVDQEWPNQDYAEILPFIQENYQNNPEKEKWSFLIVHKDDQRLIGELGCKGGPNEDGEVEIGYGIVPSYRGNGYATEAAVGIVNWLINEIGIKAVKADCLHDNIGSQRVLERAGFKRVSEDEELIYWEIKKHE